MNKAMVEAAARAKINLTLDILGKRDDGYHEVRMVMQSIELADRIRARPQAGSDITVTGTVPGLRRPQDNLVYRAAALFKEACGVNEGVSIELVKNIPTAAGLGGGSADAAAALTALNELWRTRLSQEELCRLGARLGSDVPFCIRGGTMLATGRGEELTALPPLPPCYVVLAKPPINISTAWVYRNYDAAKVKARPDTDAVLAALKRRDLPAVAGGLCNVLESVTVVRFPQLAKLKARLLACGAAAALMSGSGATIFGLTDSRDKASAIAAKLKRWSKAQVIVTKTV